MPDASSSQDNGAMTSPVLTVSTSNGHRDVHTPILNNLIDEKSQSFMSRFILRTLIHNYAIQN
jgi:hypothetical protein